MAEQIFLTGKVMCPELNSLSMDGRQVINKIRHPQSSTVPFCLLRYLFLDYEGENSVVFPLEFGQRFENLDMLSFWGSSVEEIHQGIEASQVPDGPFLRVRELRLSGFHRLRQLFENPENVKRGKAFQNIEALMLYSSGRLKRIVPFLEAFRNLKDLRVYKCNGMTYLLASSSAKCLVKLTRLSVANCKQMRDIIASKEGEAEDDIVFSRLRILALHDLPSLESFYSRNTAIRFPFLEKLILSQCPEMRSFSGGVITTQKLNQIITEIVNVNIFRRFSTEDHMNCVEYECIPRKQLWGGDINSTVQKIWENDPIIAPQDLFNDV